MTDSTGAPGAPTGDDGPAWSPDHIEATRDQVLPEQPPVLPGIDDVTQDPDAVGLDVEDDEPAEPGGARLMAATTPRGTATALILSARKNLGLGESPHGSNHNRITVWYNANIARIGDGSWCDMSVTQEAYDSGTEDAVCGGGGKGFAYCPSHAEWFRSAGHWKYGGGDLKPGDVVFYQWNGRRTTTADHVGIVEKVFADGSFYALEGNTDDVFARRHRDTTYVAGRGRPAFASIAQEDDMVYVSVYKTDKSRQETIAMGDWQQVYFNENGSVGAEQHHGEGDVPSFVNGIDGNRPSDFVGTVTVKISGLPVMTQGQARIVYTDAKTNEIKSMSDAIHEFFGSDGDTIVTAPVCGHANKGLKARFAVTHFGPADLKPVVHGGEIHLMVTER